jgi:hypothetical protein
LPLRLVIDILLDAARGANGEIAQEEESPGKSGLITN